jgi:hypothetical protein
MFHLLFPLSKIQALRRIRLADIENQLDKDIDNEPNPAMKNTLIKYRDYIIHQQEIDEIFAWYRWW